MKAAPSHSLAEKSEALEASVELVGVSKSFHGVHALKNVSLRAYPGECLGIVGENGAGKSTLMKILSGVWPSGSFQGEIWLEGEKQSFAGPRQASESGIAIIHQELSLFQELNVAENIFMQGLPSRFGVLKQDDLVEKTQTLLKQLKLKIDPLAKIKDLRTGEQQMVEIARAFTTEVKVLILDEPTSALSDREVETLFDLVDKLKEKGIACLYISHKMPELRRLCERLTVLRDGENVAEFVTKAVTDDEIISAMVGRKIENIFPSRGAAKEKPSRSVLRVENLSCRRPGEKRKVLDSVNFDLREGEILGVAGLMGAGRSELLLALFSSLKADKLSGRFFINDEEVEIDSPKAAIRHGMGLVTEDRKLTGLVLEMGVRANMTLPLLNELSKNRIIDSHSEEQLVDEHIKTLKIKTPHRYFKVRNLSGGNQQKVVLARWLAKKAKILLLDEPTRGIDVGAKAEIYHLIRKLADQGISIIMVSSELPEVVQLSDRVIVMKEGQMKAILESHEITQELIMERATAE